MGIALTVATVAALAWVNVAPSSYESAWRAVPAFGHWLGLTFSLRDWVDQGLMTAFFALVGLEIRREMTSGELASWRRASVPVAAALGGMLVPAVIYAGIVHGSVGSRGWGIPMATDVAFGIGALALVGAKASPRMRVFLMALAVADDIGSIVVLVCFYNARLRAAPLTLGLTTILVMAAIEVVRPASIGPQVLLGVLGWWALARGGAEAAVIGVAIGALALPSPVKGAWARMRGPRGWEHRLAPWLTLGVLPLFALANAGVSLRNFSFAPAGALAVFVAVVTARLVGKPLGIVLVAWGMARAPTGRYDMRLGTQALLGVGTLAGVGFTVPLLIAHAAFPDGPLVESATLGLLVGTLLCGLSGVIVLRTGGRGAATRDGFDRQESAIRP